MRSACIILPQLYEDRAAEIREVAHKNGYDRVTFVTENRAGYHLTGAPKHNVRLLATTLLDLTAVTDVFVLNHYDTTPILLNVVNIAKTYNLPMSFVDLEDFLLGLYFEQERMEGFDT